MGAEMTKNEALKLALKSLQKADKINGHSNNQKIIVAIEKALKRPEQKPVAFMREDEDCSDCIVWEQTEEHTIPLYTAPPQREWVGLTDEEIDRLNHVRVDGCSCSFCEIEGLEEFVKAIEAKLKEKNT
jgi:hypothetical protein